MRFPNARQLIFTRAPQPGRVKTRLIPRLGETAAADLHQRMLQRTVAQAVAGAICPVQLWCSPTTEHALFAGLAEDTGITLYQQASGSLGERMLHAADIALTSARYVILTGTDCPGLDSVYLGTALRKLADGCDAVLGPAEDGGYVLLGLKKSEPLLFKDIPWGTERVLSITRERLQLLGWRYAELDTLWDVDRPADVARLATEYPAILEPENLPGSIG